MPQSPITEPERRVCLDHAATTPVSAAARAAMIEAFSHWANPSSPHREGREARAALEDARRRIAAALGWQWHILFTSGASEAIALALTHTKAARIVPSVVEHDAVLRVTPDAERLAVDDAGLVTATLPGALHAIQHANNETGVIQPIAALAGRIHADGGLLFCDCAQSAGKIDLPVEADMIAISAHKFGGPPGVGALLVRDLALLRATGGQEQGYRGGTENLPGVLGMAAALEQDRDWILEASRLRAMLDDAIRQGGGCVVSDATARIPTIASYRMPGVPARVQLIRFDSAGIAVSAGAACSSGTLKTSPVLRAMGWADPDADAVIRVSFGRHTSEADVVRFLSVWRDIAGAGTMAGAA